MSGLPTGKFRLKKRTFGGYALQAEYEIAEPSKVISDLPYVRYEWRNVMAEIAPPIIEVADGGSLNLTATLLGKRL